MSEPVQGGVAAARALRSLGVDHLFTLTGGHIFPFLDGAHQAGMRIVDTRHEQSAAFAAEGWARLTRSLGVVAVTAGPGVTNALSALAQARANGAPVLALGGRAPAFRWGQGSLQEMDHPRFVDAIASAVTVPDTDVIASAIALAGAGAMTAPRGPRFLDFPLDVLFNTTEVAEPSEDAEPGTTHPDPSDVDAIAKLIDAATRPVLVAGSNVWLDRAEVEMRDFAEVARIPVYMNGQGRGCLPADHDLAFSRSRSTAFKGADLAIVAGTPMDFRLGFGQSFAPDARIVHVESHPSLLARHVDLAGSAGGSLGAVFQGLSGAVTRGPERDEWLASLRDAERAKRDGVESELRSSVSPIHPMRVYGELAPLLERNAVVICDGGDFASYAGREIASYEGGCWLDPGPFGCLGVGPGYAMAARLAYPDRQVVVLFGDGALGFSGMELETMVRLGLPAVCIVGNNGIWGLEKHPMRALYGYDVAAELRPGIRYDQMMEAFGGRGELVSDPEDIGPAFKRALDSGEPYLVNVLTDPAIAYPRSANLA